MNNIEEDILNNDDITNNKLQINSESHEYIIESETTVINNSSINISIYWIRHAESLSNINLNPLYQIRHPPLSYGGFKQSLKLGETLISIKKKFDLIYCSPSIRTIMTALISLTWNNIANKIIIIPNICENLNIIGKLKNNLSYRLPEIISNYIPNDYQNCIIPYDKIVPMLNITLEWLNNNKLNIIFYKKILRIIKKILNNINDIENPIYQELNKIYTIEKNNIILKEFIEKNILILDDTYIKEITILKKILSINYDISMINFDIYKDITNYSTFDINNFYNNILNKDTNNKSIDILCFSHKNKIKEILNLKKVNINNTQIYEQNLQLVDNVVDINNMSSNIKYIGNKYKFSRFENYNSINNKIYNDLMMMFNKIL